MLDENFVNDKFTIDDLLRRSWTYKKSEEFVKFFDFIARFQHYSRYNTMLVYIQNPAVTFFGGSSYWRKEFRRTINVDAKPHIILAPRGPIMLVYDIFDTDGTLTAAEFLELGLGNNPNKVSGELVIGKFNEILAKLGSWGVQIVYRPLSYFNGGYFRRRPGGRLEICLKEGMSNEENFSVLLHEIAHLLLGHTGGIDLTNASQKKTIQITSRQLGTEVMELEAEAISFLICKKLCLETRSAEYMANFIINDAALLTFSYEQVITTADKIEKLFL